MPSAQTDYSAITLIVVRLSQQQAGEDAAIQADPDAGAGTFVPGTPLRVVGDETNTVAALWARWNMKQSQRNAFASNLGGPILSVGQKPNLSRNSWMFDAAEGQWTPEQVLTELGYESLEASFEGYTPPPPNWP